MKKLLFNRESECLQPLRSLIEVQKHRTLALWAVDCAEPVLALFEERIPGDSRPREAIVAARKWMRGEIKMPVAKRAIHAAHNAATEAENDPVACAAARAMGHAAATVHVETHALGLAFYGLTAMVYADPARAKETVAAECTRYYDRLLYWEANTDKMDLPWAPFLLNDAPNKERALRLKAQNRDGMR